MKNLFYLLIAIITLSSCEGPQGAPPAQKFVSTTFLKDEHLMDEVSHGLHQIQINDSTTVLIYRGVESCTMIQLK
jgi:hypothetical protein